MKSIITLIIALLPLFSIAQSKTTKMVEEKYSNVFKLFFYNNTLEMLNQTNNEEFALLIKDIDKMKFLRIGRAEQNITNSDIADLISEYHDEDFEDLMTMRHEGMNVNIYIKEDDGVTEGLIFLMTDEENLSILDVKGAVPLQQVATLLSKMQDVEGFALD